MIVIKDDGSTPGVAHQPPGSVIVPPTYPFVQASSYTPLSARTTNLVVIHTMESPEKPGTAMGVARWFAGQLGPPPQASAHYCVDPTEVVQCVLERDVAWGAPGVNHRAVHIELAGRASQTAEQWADPASVAMLTLAAQLTADICRRLSIPTRRLLVREVRDGIAGICGHDDVTAAFPALGTHTNPGPNFPWQSFLTAVALG